ncbi:MAG: type II secretion system protein, partial [Sedimentisphaerales bacterium]|nr:type II secretion system protein [Sedimentisphaerales bacterium]
MNKRGCLLAGSRSGFTLVEMLVVIAIISLLAAGMIKVYHSVNVSARIKNTQATIRVLLNALQAYRDAQGSGNMVFPFDARGVVLDGEITPDDLVYIDYALNEALKRVGLNPKYRVEVTPELDLIYGD